MAGCKGPKAAMQTRIGPLVCLCRDWLLLPKEKRVAQLSRWAIFVRAFLIALLAGAPARVASATSDEVAAWSAATQSDTIDAYFSYLSRYPTGEYVESAIQALTRLGAISGAPQVRELPRTPTPVQRRTPAPQSDRTDRTTDAPQGTIY